jgi:hypothetical protein
MFMKNQMRFLGYAALVLSLMVFTGCKEVIGVLDNSVNAFMEMDETEVTLHVGETITRTASTISDGQVLYTSSDESVVSVDPITGEVAAVDGGTAIVTARVEANDFYNADAKSFKVTCYKKLSAAAAGDAGRMVCKDGHIHKLEGEAFCQAERVAMVAYVGDQSDCAHGLAIAFKDANGEAGKLTWDGAVAYLPTWEANHPVTDAAWRMPTTNDFQYMAIGCGSSTAYISQLSFGNEVEMADLCAKMAEAGADELSGMHWTSTVNKYNATKVWEINPLINQENKTARLKFVFFGKDYDGDATRYCLAF